MSGRTPRRAGERATLDAFLDAHRASFLALCSDLDAEQLARPACPPSTLTLHGLLRHLAEVEQYWFRAVLDGQDPVEPFSTPQDPDGCFGLDGADAAADLATYRAEVASAREVAARYALDDTGLRRGQPIDLRWVLTHLIEEYARHNGHADLLRQAIDGTTGL